MQECRVADAKVCRDAGEVSGSSGLHNSGRLFARGSAGLRGWNRENGGGNGGSMRRDVRAVLCMGQVLCRGSVPG